MLKSGLPHSGQSWPCHDWNYILGRLNLLNWDQAVGNLIYATGVVILAASILGGIYFSREEAKAE